PSYRLPYIKGKFNDDKCFICRDDFNERVYLWKIPCGHIYHFQCMKTCLRYSRVCPYCRTE
ncbi:hypothetical protein HELRODRAFT_138577, partial [Helobdella robusta]|uniref:RING-type domain-containing protein n=1 Tax=Helobdella robusta TaxID=6412 RepID=T1EIV6_HELRO